jgi:hypothetical protein
LDATGSVVIGRAIACNLDQQRILRVMNAQAAIIQVKMANAATIMKTRDDLIKLGANNEKARATPCCANKPRKLNFSSLPSFVTNLRHRSLPKGQHLLLVGRVAVRLNETAGPV